MLCSTPIPITNYCEYAFLKGEELGVYKEKGWPYRYYLLDTKPNGILVKAVNKMGGRSYVYDSEWNVVHYVFSSPEEELTIGRQILRWMTEANLSKEEMATVGLGHNTVDDITENQIRSEQTDDERVSYEP